MQLCLIASLIARVNEKARLKACGSYNQLQNNRIDYEFNYDLSNLLLVRRQDFTRITEVETRNAHHV